MARLLFDRGTSVARTNHIGHGLATPLLLESGATSTRHCSPRTSTATSIGAAARPRRKLEPDNERAERRHCSLRRLRMPLLSLRRARRDVALAQPANGRAGDDDDSGVYEAEVGGAAEMDDNDVGDAG